MEIEQIIKQLDWLDDERRKDKTTISSIERNLDALQINIPELEKSIKNLSGELTRIQSSLSRFDQIESNIMQVKVDLSRTIEENEKQSNDKYREAEKGRLADLESMTKSIGDVKKTLVSLQDIKKDIAARVDEDYRLGRLIEELKQTIEQNHRNSEDYHRSQRLLEEGRRQDSKRLVDLQNEVSAIRKRLDEQRGKMEVASDNIRKFELRLNELQANDAERKQAFNTFSEKQAMLQVERDRTWREWQTHFAVMKELSDNLDVQIESLETMNRTIKRSQESFDEITERFERRINEITEMQRLSDERFRQEWVAFKADDQKRWTNYTLSQEEQQHEITRQLEKAENRITSYEDKSVEIQDFLQESTEESQKRLHTALSMLQEWINEQNALLDRLD